MSGIVSLVKEQTTKERYLLPKVVSRVKPGIQWSLMSTGKSSGAETMGIVHRQLPESMVWLISRKRIYEKIDLRQQNLL